jgi:lipopolysaccharide/colanic/teichoic acid biosynthesis glycosyltransferase
VGPVIDDGTRRSLVDTPVTGREGNGSMTAPDGSGDLVPVGISTWRRTLDVVVAGGLLVVALPVLTVAGALVVLTSGRPALFRQVRIGERAQPFTLTKLRTMRSGSGLAVTTIEDTRITGLGRALRRTSVDELPQLWDVLRGRMTLVGPRPESLELAVRYPDSARFVLQARPGLTGPSQLTYRERAVTPPPGRDAESWYLEVLVPLRAQTDLEYLRNPSPRATLRYLVRTALFVTGLASYESGAPSPARETG